MRGTDKTRQPQRSPVGKQNRVPRDGKSQRWRPLSPGPPAGRPPQDLSNDSTMETSMMTPTSRKAMAAAVILATLTALPMTASAAKSKAAMQYDKTEVMTAQQELNKEGAGLK